MRLGNEIHKTAVQRGSQIKVRGRIGRLMDARAGSVKVEFKWRCFKWCRWIPLREVELPTPEAKP